jgi:hypothetical protein
VLQLQQLQQLWRSCGEVRILRRANTVEDARCVGEATTRPVRVQDQSVQMCTKRSESRRTGANERSGVKETSGG